MSTEQVLQEVRDWQTRHDERMQTFRDDLVEIKTALYGNGQPGLKARVADAEANLKMHVAACEIKTRVTALEGTIGQAKAATWGVGKTLTILGGIAVVAVDVGLRLFGK